jgi:hypothetical protein
MEENMIEKKTIILIGAHTGCSCCSNENHYRGPYESTEDAERRKAYYLSPDSKFWPLASQYASRGRYELEEYTIEFLDDGRVIFRSEVYGPDELSLKTVMVNDDGTVQDPESEFFCSMGW